MTLNIMSYSGSQELLEGLVRRSPRILIKKWKTSGPTIFSNKQIIIENMHQEYSLLFDTVMVTFNINLRVNSNVFKYSNLLPTEILHKIFNYFSYDDLQKLILTESSLSKDCQLFVFSKFYKKTV